MRKILPALLTVPALLLLAGCGGPTLIDYAQHGWGLGICGTIVLIMDVIAIIEISGSDRTFGGKVLWVLLLIFFPVGGLLIYYFFGR